jgi:GGDEF domain-containing protein
LSVELDAFDDVRTVAGQLSAERVVADAAARLEGAIRQGDSCRQVSEDSFEVTISVSSAGELDVVSERIRAALAGVSVPSRARPIRARVHELSGDTRRAV